MAANEVNSVAVVVLPYKNDRKERNTNIVEEGTCEDGDIVEAKQCEDDENNKKVISDMDEEALPLE